MFNLLPFLFNKKSFLKNDSNNDESNEYIIIDKNFKFIPLLLLAVAFFYKSSTLQISPQVYYDNYLLNTSQIDILEGEMALGTKLCV